MKRKLLIISALCGVTFAASFSGFDIKPKGNQDVDLVTGVTTLPQGGLVTDSKNGIKIDAQYIEMKEGEFLKARTAKLTTSDGGLLTASNVEYSVKQNNLTATGKISYQDSNIKDLGAEKVVVHTRDKLIVASGGVQAESPAIKANMVLADYDKNVAVLYGNYSFQSGKQKLSNKSSTGTLFVKFNAKGEATATTKPTAEQLAVFKPYLK
ncbi:hypothetical protein [Deinococcus roseus]|uniref:Organic solvent tolerance-like N-terminal domain-containing protein n=1 Tax=Deinococcus roseus TaxID=392414 RepID=A0ABQ2CYX0_9DEIO|nr:hypothetical protein [Deinococcus roseus]GGJ30412.1 hypothetical protein GCM10008938_15560 [Deinococcus roseus]